MKKHFLAVFLMVLFCATTALAGSGWFSASSKVTHVVAHDWGEVALIYLESNVTYPSGCPTQGVVAISKDHPFFKETFNVAMTALITQKPVNGWMIGTCYRAESSAAGLGMPFITRLDIYR